MCGWRFYSCLITLILIIFSPEISVAQAHPTDSLKIAISDTSHVQILKLKDGSEVIGRTIEIGEDDILFQSNLGTNRVRKSDIAQITTIPRESAKPGGYWFPNPNVTRLYFAPTGRMLKKGQGYFSDYYLFFPGLTGAFSDRVSVGAGFSLFPGVGLEKQLYYLTPEIGLYQSERLNFAVGGIYAAAPGWDIDGDDIPTFGAVYGIGSCGPPDAFLTGGLAFAFAEDDFEGRPAVLIGGQGRLSRNIAFVSENWKFPGADFVLTSYGLRFFGSRMSFDLGFFNTMGGEDGIGFPGLPWVDFVYNFK
ncbi:MAG: hypothetical protein A2W25_09730 [candidate division Zixibacteria bacterium RBG_16_53_22]|nr:MAG: hypothetical protein A2W25_09730 [candidate division Zixibacteria bacterium RBG_16_53_22]